MISLAQFAAGQVGDHYAEIGEPTGNICGKSGGIPKPNRFFKQGSDFLVGQRFGNEAGVGGVGIEQGLRPGLIEIWGVGSWGQSIRNQTEILV